MSEKHEIAFEFGAYEQARIRVDGRSWNVGYAEAVVLRELWELAHAQQEQKPGKVKASV